MDKIDLNKEFLKEDYNGYFELIPADVLGGKAGVWIARVYSRAPHHLIGQQLGTETEAVAFVRAKMSLLRRGRELAANSTIAPTEHPAAAGDFQPTYPLLTDEAGRPGTEFKPVTEERSWFRAALSKIGL